MDRSLPGASAHGILHARILEWVAISFSRGCSQHKNWTQVSYTAGRFFTKWAIKMSMAFLNASVGLFVYPFGTSALSSVQFIQSLSHVYHCATPWTAAHQASLSTTNSWSLPKTLPIELVCHLTISSSVLPFSSCLQPFPTSGSFQMSQLFTSGGQNLGVSASTSVLPTNTQDWFPLGWTGWISLQPKGLSRVFSNTTLQKHQFFSTQLSL